MDKNQIPVNFEFPITVSGLKQISPTLSQGRCRIFYKYANRNGSYITDEFADKLISTLPYAPVKGIYDEGEGDYMDHGKANRQGRIYGIVPADPHVTWERHLDEDGEEREYATCDVLVYTALYEEANNIFGKSQSMELYPPSICGDWQIINGQSYFTFTEGCFFGLQVLGDEVEPCFEGAAFFSLNEMAELKQIANELKTYLDHSNGGKSDMADIEEMISSETEVVEEVVNEEFAAAEVTEAAEIEEIEVQAEENFEEAPIVEETVEEAPTEFEAEAEETAENSVEEPIEEFSTVEGEMEVESEETPVDYSAILADKENELNAVKEENQNYCTKINELEAQVSTLNMEKEAVEKDFQASQEKVTALEAEVAELNAFKMSVEKAQKEEVINSYAEMLSGEVIEEFTAKIDEYTAVELDKELAYALKNSNISAFSKTPSLIPKEVRMDGLSELLSHYTK